jgi:cellulose biosynthesis protein BcsQ
LDDLASLVSLVGLDPAAYRTFQSGRTKSLPPAQDKDATITNAPADDSAGKPTMETGLESRAEAAVQRSEPLQAAPIVPVHRPISANRPSLDSSRLEDASYTTEPLKKLIRFSKWDRWAALDAVLSSAGRGSVHMTADLRPKKIPAVSIGGVAGGVGTSSIVAALARISARRGDQVIVFDASSDSLLSLFFSGRHSPVPMASFVFSGDANRGAIHTFRRDDADLGESTEAWLTRCLDSLVAESDELVIDAGLNRSCRPHHSKISDSMQVLTLVPDTRCVAALRRLEDLKEARADHSGGPLLLLNQFDQSDPLHTEIRARLANRYPHRLIPIPIRRDRQVPAALAEGMTIIDYAPESSAAEDLIHLDQWFQSRQRQDSSEELEKVQIL